MRQTFELHIRCAQCGRALELCYEDQARMTVQKSTESTNITGADKVKSSLFVEPCRTCLEPLVRLQKAFEVLSRGSE